MIGSADLTIRDKDTSRLDELANLYNKTKDKIL